MNCPHCKKEMDHSCIVLEGTAFVLCRDCVEKLSQEERQNWFERNVRIAKRIRENQSSPWDK